MVTQEVQREALDRARTSRAVTNYPAIFAGFRGRGIAQTDIRPRENIFTYHAWKALGRQVCKGEKGVRVLTWIPVKEKRDAVTGEVEREAGRRPRAATVFHVSQTKPL